MSDQTTVPDAFVDLLEAPIATFATIGPDVDGDDQRRVAVTIRPTRVVAIDLSA